MLCAHVDVDQVYAIAHLRDRAAGYNAIESQRHVLGAEPQLARLVLVDPYAHDARRLGPVEVDVAYPRHRLQLLGNLQRDLMHAREVRSADAVFDRPADGRPKLERIDACDHRGEPHCDRLLQTRAHLVTLLQTLGDHHRLREEVVGQRDVERQIEANGALPDIGGEAHDIGVGGEHLVELRCSLTRGQHGGIVLQLQVHQELRTVGGREELLRDEAEPP